MEEITEKAMRESFRETVALIEESPILRDIFKKGAENMIACKELSNSNLLEKIHYAMVFGFSVQRMLKKRFYYDITQGELHKKRDGYEIIFNGQKSIVLTEKNSNFTNAEILELARKELNLTIPDTALVRKLSEFEVMKLKKEVLTQMSEKE